MKTFLFLVGVFVLLAAVNAKSIFKEFDEEGFGDIMKSVKVDKDVEKKDLERDIGRVTSMMKNDSDDLMRFIVHLLGACLDKIREKMDKKIEKGDRHEGSGGPFGPTHPPEPTHPFSRKPSDQPTV